MMQYKVYTICVKGVRMGKRVLVGESSTAYTPVRLSNLKEHLIQDSVEFDKSIKLEVTQ